MSPKKKKILLLIFGGLFIQQTFGGMTFPVAKMGLAVVPPFTFGFYRFILASVVLLTIVVFKRHDRTIDKADRWKIIGLGCLIVPFNQAAYLYGQSLTGAGHASLLFATTPVWIYLAAMLHLKERLVVRRAVGIVIALAGVGITMAGGAIVISADYLWGDLIVLFAVLVWAYYTIFGKPLVRKYGALRVTAYALASGTALYFPFGLYHALKTDHSLITPAAWGSILYVAIGTSVIAYTIWYWLLKQMDASRLAVYQNVQPIIAGLAAYLWLGEPLGLEFIAGGVVVLTGVIIAEV